jgi:hypothetical protein
VKLNFLLDENILYHAIRGVDLRDQPDDTATRLIRTIVQVCHSLVIHEVVRVKYIKILDRLKDERSLYLLPAYFFNQVLKRADKRSFEYEGLPTLPEECNDVPRKDEYLVQAALLSHPLLVTSDENLYKALKNHPELGIEVLWPHEALHRAQSGAAD